MSKSCLFLWDVSCQGYNSVTVAAVDAAAATVAAAKKWNAKWREIVAYCDVKNKRVYNERGF